MILPPRDGATDLKESCEFEWNQRSKVYAASVIEWLAPKETDTFTLKSMAKGGREIYCSACWKRLREDDSSTHFDHIYQQNLHPLNSLAMTVISTCISTSFQKSPKHLEIKRSFCFQLNLSVLCDYLTYNIWTNTMHADPDINFKTVAAALSRRTKKLGY